MGYDMAAMVVRLLVAFVMLGVGGAALLTLGLVSDDAPTSAEEYRQRELEQYFTEMEAFFRGTEARYEEVLAQEGVRLEAEDDPVAMFRDFIGFSALADRALAVDLAKMRPPKEARAAHEKLRQYFLDQAATVEAEAAKITDAASLDEYFIDTTGSDPHFRDFPAESSNYGVIGGFEDGDSEDWNDPPPDPDAVYEDFDTTGGVTMVLEADEITPVEVIGEPITVTDVPDSEWLGVCRELRDIADGHDIDVYLRCAGTRQDVVLGE